MQIFSDVFGIPAVRNEVNGSASLGSAICAAVAVCAYDTFAAAMEKMVRISDIFHPIAEHTSLYERMNNDVYKSITGITDPILEKSYSIFKQ
jgi:sugar (pentulose or hexulose) kinase